MGRKQLKIALFGHFDGSNFGNESTFKAMLDHLRSLLPGAGFTCICTGPAYTAETYGISAIPIRESAAGAAVGRNWLTKLLRKIFIGVPNEIGRWMDSIRYLGDKDALIIPGTGLLTDAYGLLSWGPYDMFRWAVAAKIQRCKVLFVSVGAGPVYSRSGRFFVKSALRLADYRSYRDSSTRQYLNSLGFKADKDPVYPDLAFSLFGLEERSNSGRSHCHRPVVGLGLMEYAGKYSVEQPNDAVPAAYLKTLAEFVRWLLSTGYDIRLLSGDMIDEKIVRNFHALLQQSTTYDADRLCYEPIRTAGQLMTQIESSDLVVGTRFHNILLSLLLNRPAIAISFHHKCSSLMEQMGLREYCEDINGLTTDRLIAAFSRLQQNDTQVKQTIREHVKGCEKALGEQYGTIIRTIAPGTRQVIRPAAEIRES